MKKVLFWDFHGTLIRPDHIWSWNIYQAARDAFPECPISLQLVRDRLDRDGFPWHHPEENYLDLIEPAAWWNYVNKLFYATYRRCGLTEANARQIVPDVRTRILDPANYVLFDSAVKVLGNLRQSGWHHFLLSNNFPELPEICRKIGIGDYFEQVIVSARVGYEKPRREIFQSLQRSGPSAGAVAWIELTDIPAHSRINHERISPLMNPVWNESRPEGIRHE